MYCVGTHVCVLCSPCASTDRYFTELTFIFPESFSYGALLSMFTLWRLERAAGAQNLRKNYKISSRMTWRQNRQHLNR